MEGGCPFLQVGALLSQLAVTATIALLTHWHLAPSMHDLHVHAAPQRLPVLHASMVGWLVVSAGQRSGWMLGCVCLGVDNDRYPS